MTNVALVDVRHIDGEPWDVAAVAGKQVLGALDLAIEALEGFQWAARGSWLSQEEYRTGCMPTLTEFLASPLGGQIEGMLNELRAARIRAAHRVAAASHDPRSY